MRNEIYLKEGVKELIYKFGLKNYGFILDFDYTIYDNVIDMEINQRITDFKELRENQLIIDSKSIISDKELIIPARGIKCNHLQNLELDDLIVFVMKRK